MVNLASLKTGMRIIFHNPSLVFDLFTFDFDKIFCSYWNLKLKKCRNMYEKLQNDNRNIFEEIKIVNKKILNEKPSINEGYIMSLYFMIRIQKPNVVIETGVHRGVSTSFILQALEDNNKGNLYSIDLPLAKYGLPREKLGICVSDRLKKDGSLFLVTAKKNYLCF